MTMPSHYEAATGSCLAVLLMTTSCQSLTETPPATMHNEQSLKQINNQSYHSLVSAKPQINQQSLTQQALHIQQALANSNYASIIKDIHPTRGVRFSMYAYVRPERDKVFSRAQFTQYLQQSKVRFTWGDLDGTGDLLITPLPEYLDTWVDGSKFNNASVKVNKVQQNGNTINNLKEIYPKSEVVEFYYKGSNEYEGMDWRALRLVFDDYQGRRYLVAIINSQWTV